VFGVTDEEDTLDGIKGVSGQPFQGVDGSGGSLRVTLKVETVSRVRGEGRGDLPDDVGGTGAGLLAKVGSVDGAVDLSSLELGSDPRVHGSESGRRALPFTGSTGVDDAGRGDKRESVRNRQRVSHGYSRVSRAGSRDGSLSDDGRGHATGDSAGEGDEGGGELDHFGMRVVY
jgi:hypothetical protein